MKLLAIDPGTTQSAFVEIRDGGLGEFGIIPNEELLRYIRHYGVAEVVIEEIKSYGMPVGETIFNTVRWSGRFEQRAIDVGSAVYFIPRLEVKKHLCKDSRANDSTIKQALIDRFGEPGTKKKPGILYGVKKDMWAALALAVTFADTHK